MPCDRVSMCACAVLFPPPPPPPPPAPLSPSIAAKEWTAVLGSLALEVTWDVAADRLGDVVSVGTLQSSSNETGGTDVHSAAANDTSTNVYVHKVRAAEVWANLRPSAPPKLR